jgi:hypothetical protein
MQGIEGIDGHWYAALCKAICFFWNS